MSSQRTGTAGSARASPSSSSPASLAARPPRGVGATSKDSARTPSGSASNANGRSGAHTSSATRSPAAAAAGEVEGGPELVAQLQERLQQLEAEFKASQDTAQWTIKQNKNTLLALKQENKELSAEVARRGGSTELQCKQGTATDGEKVVERLERQVHELRRAHDKVVKDKKTAVQRLDNLHDNLKDLARVSAAAAANATSSTTTASAAAGGGGVSSSISSAASTAALAAAAAAALPASSPAARELRQLQNRLDKAVVKANEAYSIRKTYEQVVEKLRVEEPLLEARIRGLQEQRAAKQAALQAVTLTSRELHAAKEGSKAALAALETEVAANRAGRVRVLADMRDKAATLQQTNRALLQRQFQPLHSSPSSTSAAPDSDPSTSALAAAPPSSSIRPFPLSAPFAVAPASSSAFFPASPASAAVAAAEAEDITARDLIVRLCRTTGAKRVSELLARLLAQQESYRGLQELRSQATAQRLALVQETEMLRAHRDELRGGGKMSTQRQMDAAQEELAQAAARAEAAQEALEAALRGAAEVRGGLSHLSSMSAPLPLPPGAQAGGQPPVAPPLEDENLGEGLAQIEQRLVGSYRVIAALPKAVELLEGMYAQIRHE